MTDVVVMWARIGAIAASFLFAAGYRSISGTAVAPGEVLFISVGAGLATLLGGMTVGVALKRRGVGVRDAMMLRNLLVVSALVVFASLLSFWAQDASADRLGARTWLQFALVGGLSGLVGFGEVVSRYRDDPGRLFAASPAATYVGVNVLAGLGALMLVHEFNVFDGDPHHWVKEAMLAGFGAIAFFRSSLFTVRVAGSDVGIGPSAVLKSILDASELMIDRWQAGNRGDDAGVIMQTVDFNKAYKALPMMCFSMLQQAVSEQQQTASRQEIDDLAADLTIPPETKALLLGVYLVRLVGGDVLRKAVATLDGSIR